MAGHACPLPVAACLLFLAFGCASTETQSEGESQIVGEVQVKWRGNVNLSNRQLERRIADDLLVFERSRKKSVINDAAFSIAEYYRDEGYPDVQVDYQIDEAATEVKFVITEGRRVALRNVVFEGNQHVSDAVLRAYFEAPAEGLLEFRNDAFVEAELSDAREEIESFYLNDGYLRVNVAEPQVFDHGEQGVADVFVRVDEGPRFRIRSMTMAVDPEELQPLLLARAEVKIGDTFTQRSRGLLRRRLMVALEAKGYPDPDVRVRPQIDREQGLVDLDIVANGGRLARVDSIEIEGLERTDRSFVERYLTLQVGQVYDGSALDTMVRELFRTGVFSRARVSHEWVADDLVRVVIELEERHARTLSFLAGWGSYELARGKVTYSDRNLFGSGRQFTTSLLASLRSARADVSLTEPRLFGSPFAGTISTFAGYREEPSFTVGEAGVTLSVDREWTSTVRTSTGYNYTYSKLLSDDILDDQDLTQNRLTVGRLFGNLDYDGRDSAVLPREGFSQSTGVDFANQGLGSEIDFLRFRVSASYLIPLGERTVFALGARGGIIYPLGPTETIPLQERFFNGGENTVRSFREGRLGPTDDEGDPIGGEYFTVFNAELRIPIRGPLGLTLFTDAGNVGLDAGRFGLDDLRYAIGAGLRFDLPIGPIRLDYGRNPDPHPDEDSYALHFSVGFAF